MCLRHLVCDEIGRASGLLVTSRIFHLWNQDFKLNAYVSRWILPSIIDGLGTYLNEIWSKPRQFSQKNEFENAVCKVSVILFRPLTHWGRVTHRSICISKLAIIGSDNGLAPGRRQTIIWTNDGILLIGPLGTNFSEILIGIQTFTFKKMHLKMSSAKWRPFCPASKCCDIWNFRPWANYTKYVSSLQTSVIKQLAILVAIYTTGEL